MTADVAEDGSIGFRDPTAISDVHISGLGWAGRLELTDQIMKLAGQDPYASIKRDMAESTREERQCMRFRQRRSGHDALSLSTKASACDEEGGLPWIGTTGGLTNRLDRSRIRPSGLIGGELGISIPIRLHEHGRCPLVGIGAKFFYSGNWIGALPLRISYPLPSKSHLPALYLQAGPALRWGTPGIDVEAGFDWIFAAAFVGTTWFPDGDDCGATLVVGARVSLLLLAWWLAVESSGGFIF